MTASSSKSSLRILVIEDNETMRTGIAEVLKKSGHAVMEAPGGEKGLSLLENENIDLVITDYKMAGMDGLAVLKQIKVIHPNIEIMVITAYGSIELAVEAMKAGAWDFITKPFSKDELKLKVDRVAAMLEQSSKAHRLAEENRYLREEFDIRLNYGEIVGESPGMKSIYRAIEKIADTDASVLIYGESGTGKELVARAIHFHSRRKENPFIRVNCSALAEGVLESELFGHEKGAFTGAIKQKKGRFELADSGTLFLDEIGDIPLSTQVKLLRVLQEKEFERVGGEETIRVDVRVLAATHRNLIKEIETARFREDLYYRLHILPIEIPPLRDRKMDIPLLVSHFLERKGEELKKTGLKINEEALAILKAYDWPGNVRELENILERAVVLSEGNTINEETLIFMVAKTKGTKIAEPSLNLESRLASAEKHLLEQAMLASKGNKAKAARILGIKEGTLYYKLNKYGLSEMEQTL